MSRLLNVKERKQTAFLSLIDLWTRKNILIFAEVWKALQYNNCVCLFGITCRVKQKIGKTLRFSLMDISFHLLVRPLEFPSDYFWDLYEQKSLYKSIKYNETLERETLHLVREAWHVSKLFIFFPVFRTFWNAFSVRCVTQYYWELDLGTIHGKVHWRFNCDFKYVIGQCIAYLLPY